MWASSCTVCASTLPRRARALPPCIDDCALRGQSTQFGVQLQGVAKAGSQIAGQNWPCEEDAANRETHQTHGQTHHPW